MNDFRSDEFSFCTKFSAKIEKIRRGERKRVKEIQYPRPCTGAVRIDAVLTMNPYNWIIGFP